jgi:hypothetical protein
MISSVRERRKGDKEIMQVLSWLAEGEKREQDRYEALNRGTNKKMKTRTKKRKKKPYSEKLNKIRKRQKAWETSIRWGEEEL